MKKLFKDFKKFINRGNVIDLAVGMIIGSAFTAIVTSMVNGILKPLLSCIPGSGETGALQTVLKKAVTDAEGNVITDAVVLDWGGVISAIVTFLLTAIILFLIVKAFNKMKDASEKAKEAALKAAEKLKAEEQAQQAAAKEQAEQAAAEAATEPEVTEPKESVEDLLRQIRDALAAKAE